MHNIKVIISIVLLIAAAGIFYWVYGVDRVPEAAQRGQVETSERDRAIDCARSVIEVSRKGSVSEFLKLCLNPKDESIREFYDFLKTSSVMPDQVLDVGRRKNDPEKLSVYFDGGSGVQIQIVVAPDDTGELRFWGAYQINRSR